jgi:hypothetical protein
LDFGFCAVKQVTTQQFEFTNTGDVAQSYRWRLDAPFALSPESGMLGPKQVQTVTATLKPTTASVFTAHVRLRVSLARPPSLNARALRVP